MTFRKVAFRTAVVSATGGTLTVEVDYDPLCHPTNGLLTAVANCSHDNIG